MTNKVLSLDADNSLQCQPKIVGFDLIGAEISEEGGEKSLSEKPDGVILDWMMPNSKLIVPRELITRVNGPLVQTVK